MPTSPRYGFDYLEVGEAVPSEAVNEALERIEAGGGHFIIEDRDLTAPPGSPDPGDTYIIATGATGDWATHDGNIAYRLNTAWIIITMLEGFTFWVKDENVFLVADSPTTFAEFETTATGTYMPFSYLDTDDTLAADSDVKVPSQQAVKAFVASAVTGLLDLKGSTDCSANPNYPAASKGDTYLVSVAGKIGGASGTTVEVGDVYVATADNAGGTQAAVGTSWMVLQGNILSGAAVTFATAAEIRAGTEAAKAIAPDQLSAVRRAVTSQSGTSYTAVLADGESYIRFSNASAISFTIPPNSSVAFPVGTVIEVEQAGAGALSFVAGSGVTLNSRASDLTLAGQYAVAFAKKVATDTWTVNGDL